MTNRSYLSSMFEKRRHKGRAQRKCCEHSSASKIIALSVVQFVLGRYGLSPFAENPKSIGRHYCVC